MDNIPPTKISDETFYWLIRYEAMRGGNVCRAFDTSLLLLTSAYLPETLQVDAKTISQLLDIKNNAAYMQISRAKKRLETAGACLDVKEGGGEDAAEKLDKGKGGAGKKRAASVADEPEGLDGMMNPKKKAKGKKVKVEEADEEE